MIIIFSFTENELWKKKGFFIQELFEEKNTKEMKTGFLNVINNSNLRNQCIQNGFKNINRFKTEIIVEKYRKIYKEFWITVFK